MKTTTPAPPLTIDPHTIYRYKQLQAALGLPECTLRAEIRAGRLRVSKRCRRYWILGQWLLDWIAGGAVQAGGDSSKLSRGTVLNCPPLQEGA